MNEALNKLQDKLQKNDSVVVAVSGGPDSMALLDTVCKLKEKLNLKITCAHVNHKLRAESEAEAIMVRDYCEKKGIFFEFMTIDSYNDDNFHNDARIKRYDFFEKSVKKCQAKYLLTAHHGDDLMETVLMRIVRGSTLSGYAGFAEESEKEGYKILRPLITYTKDEILNYVIKNGIPYAVDKSNDKDVYTRNRFRKYILPPLKKEDNNVHLKFYKFSKTLEMYSKYIDKETQKIMKVIYQNEVLAVEKFKAQDEVIRLKIINLILEKLYQDDLMLITDKHTEMICEMLYSDKANLSINLPNNKKALKSYDEFKIISNIENSGYNYEFDNFLTLPNGKTLEKVSSTEDNSNYICRLSSEEIKFPLYVRTRKDGDKMEIKGLEGTKKIKDIFIDSKIPKEERDVWPILTDKTGKIVWLPGIKKSKFNKQKIENYDIIIRYH